MLRQGTLQENDVVNGGCFCGAVQYEAAEPLYPATLCHCTSCRRANGAHAVGWYTIAAVEIRYTRGAPIERESSAGVFRGYCPTCFSPITYRTLQRPDELDVTIASLDDPDRVPPFDHIYMEDAAWWDDPGDGRPQHAGRRFAY
jgi:hypothetical protein